MKKHLHILLSFILSVSCLLTSCSYSSDSGTAPQTVLPTETSIVTPQAENTVEPTNTQSPTTFSLESIPDFSGKPYVEINNNVPYFTNDDLQSDPFETYSPLDSLGRCGVAYACIDPSLMPTEERGSIGQIKPSGWHTVKYDFVDGKYLYNRCHLIGYQLTAENANEKNLITGTRYMNVDGMLPFENMVADYIEETGNRVLYRVTPIFNENNLVANGVLMEGYSVEDNGDGICYNVYVYNIQPGVIIDYSTGDSRLETNTNPTERAYQNTEASEPQKSNSADYIGNKNTKKFHYPSCSSLDQMKESNKDYLHCTRDEAIAKGYDPCKRCNP